MEEEVIKKSFCNYCLNKGKDCLTAHYELMGIAPTIGYDVFNYGPFPRPLLEKIASTIQKPIIGNIVSDTKSAIEKLYKRQLETKSLIIYTTGDSNLEVAADETAVDEEALNETAVDETVVEETTEE